MATVSKTRLIFGIFLLVLIVIIDLALHHLHLAAWPAFMVMIFFFESHMNPNRAPHILLGGLFGILNLVLIGMFLKVAAPPPWHPGRQTRLCLPVRLPDRCPG